MSEVRPIADPRITVIGGGTGTATIYPEIARLTPNAVALVGMSDSGGSSGRLMAEYTGLPPLGDLSNVITAASDNPAIQCMRRLRFPEGNAGALTGHSARNMALAGFVLEYGLAMGTRLFSQAMQARGRILPITLDYNRLVMEDGPDIIEHEHIIDRHEIKNREPWVWLEPAAKINPEAERIIDDSDLIVIAAGSPYTSQLAALSVLGVCEALRTSKAPKVLVANLVNEKHDTDGWHVVDYVRALQRHDVPIDTVLFNTMPPTEEMRKSYEQEGKQPVAFEADRFVEVSTVRAIGASLLSTELDRPNPLNPNPHGLMRHDGRAVAAQLFNLLAAQENR